MIHVKHIKVKELISLASNRISSTQKSSVGGTAWPKISWEKCTGHKGNTCE